MMTKDKEIPEFASAEEEAVFWEKNSVAPFWDQLETVEVKAERPRKRQICIRLNPTYLSEIKKVALKKGIPYQTLIQMWLVEKLMEQRGR
ncbi:CopG antitoxin of type II toxin-antitoxin system [Neomoorella glycerini]|uniref:CopG antitoxin of type II toxin-antitoxin system n=1 Tax=Neomoorella glycerini TaxID=55779 RepID=A0A6I5ZUU0_9FIRM|nr:CopG family antitoxin [Moorella glycerini]QGP93425.1 CopG antitoxin of type II toxin-antitoxin system [Moorella glycerini]